MLFIKSLVFIFFAVFCFSFPYFAFSAELSKKEHVEDKWMSLAEAQVVVQEAGIQSYREFREWSKSGKRPFNFPSNPDVRYKEEWKGWRYFLGTGERRGKNWMSLAEAQAYIQEAGIQTEPKFKEWSKSGKRPFNFPSHPERVYKEEWVSWYHFLGTEGRRIVKEWMSFAEAQAHVQEAGIKTSLEFREWIKAGKKPLNFPSHPERVYKEEWVSYPHFFGTEGRRGKDWMSLAEAQAHVQEAGIQTVTEFREWSKSGKRPPNLPSDPAVKYKKEWKGWPHFLGTKGKRRVVRKWMKFAEAQVVVQKKGIKKVSQFREWSKSGKRPPNLPSDPAVKYKKEWKGWPHFLGTAKCKKAFK